jgi:hypothetical protein
MPDVSLLMFSTIGVWRDAGGQSPKPTAPRSSALARSRRGRWGELRAQCAQLFEQLSDHGCYAGTTQPSGIQGGYCYLYTLTGTDHVGNAASVKVTIKVPIGIAAMTLASGGSTAGKPEQNDTISIQLNGPLSVNSVCSTWSNNNANQSLTNATVTFVNGGVSNDSVSFSSPSCTLHLGTINLGSTGYVTSGSVTFGATGTGSTIAYSASSDTITITLGTQQASTTLGTVSASVATFTPSGFVGVDGNTPATFATASTQQF